MGGFCTSSCRKAFALKEFIISEKEAGITVFRYSSRLMVSAPGGLIHKFIRNKNIELNGRKCREKDILKSGDRVCFFLSDETFEKFCTEGSGHEKEQADRSHAGISLDKSRILYEDEDYLFYDKPAGLRSQSDAGGRVSLNDMLLGYTGVTGVFRPSICNRLDTNTSGIVLCGKSVKGLQNLNKAIRDRRIRKFYRCLLSGRIEEDMHLVSFLSSSEMDNKVSILDEPKKGYREIITELSVIKADDSFTYAEIHLITGRKHQIRAQMAHIGHPVAGDRKYGTEIMMRDDIKRTMLHAFRVELPEEILDGLTVYAPVPEDMQRIIKEL